jgi:hypothetical protein
MQLTVYGLPSDAGPAKLGLYPEPLRIAAKTASDALCGASRP